MPYETRCKTSRTSAKVRAMKSHRNFSQRTHQIHPVGPKLTFWCVSYYMGAFGTVWLPYETRWKMGRTSANLRATKSRQNFSQRTHSIHPIWPETDVLVHFVPFLAHPGPFGCVTKLVAKLAQLVQKFVPRSRVGMFRKECTRSTHWTLNSCFCVFRCN